MPIPSLKFQAFTSAPAARLRPSRAVGVDAPIARSKPISLVVGGDSIDFTYNPCGDAKVSTTPSPGDLWAQDLEASTGHPVTVRNLAQPGETSGSFLDKHARNNGGWIDDEQGNRVQQRALKFDYDTAQVQAIKQVLREHPETDGVILSIGPNDLLLLPKDAEAAGAPRASYTAKRLPKTLSRISKNVSSAIAELRQVYAGPIILQNQYSTNYSDRLINVALRGESLALRIAALRQWRPGKPVRIANVYTQMREVMKGFPEAEGDPWKAGLLYTNEAGTADSHPNPAGQRVIADAVAKKLYPFLDDSRSP